MRKAQWIWARTPFAKDAYCAFCERFVLSPTEHKKNEKILLRIACDGHYAAYLNGDLVAFSQCSDFPWYKLYDEIELSQVCVADENTLEVQVWHAGEDSQTYIADIPGVLFEVTQGGAVLAYSNARTPSRVMNEYENGACRTITRQLGFGFAYDTTVQKSAYGASVRADKTQRPHRRERLPLVLGERLPVAYTQNGNVLTADMGKEVAGFVELRFYSPARQKITFCYGEHLAHGRVRRRIGDRDFSFIFTAEKGENVYLPPFRRIAGRFIEAHCVAPIEPRYIGIRPVMYPVAEVPFALADQDLQRIYDAGVYTLRCCMHEHYEDCPWREQALYALDSRNQMLCGYVAFENGNRAYARHNLLLLSKSLRKDGLLSICAPSGIDIPIPFFSLVFVLQACEYMRFTGDKSILAEVGETIGTVLQTFADTVDESGLIPSFPYPYWNFYEWAEESHNDWQIERTPAKPYVRTHDLILNCMYVYARETYGKTTGAPCDMRAHRENIRKAFYKNDVFVLSDKTEKYSQLGNALAVLIGLGGGDLADRIQSDADMIPATLAMRAFVYDALLACGDGYKAYVLGDIRARWGKMLQAGATTFWETEAGAADFGGAGSLCHGWSAVPVYYLHSLRLSGAIH